VIARRAALAGLAAAAAPTCAWAGRSTTVLVGASPDSQLDKITRLILPHLARQDGVGALVLRNLPGEGGLHALRALTEATPSGATLGWVASPTVPARMVDRGGGELRQGLTLIGTVLQEPIVFVSPASAPLESMRDVIRKAAEDSDAIPLSTPPPGSPPHLAALRLQAIAGTRLTIVTFPSAAAARQAVQGGNVSAAAMGLSDAIGALRDGRLHGIGLAARNRFGMLPDLPVLKEAGVPLAASIRRGLAGPAGLPEETVTRLRDAIRAMVRDQAFREHADELGLVPVWLDAATWWRIIDEERDSLARLWRTDPWLPSSSG
jgi:tripartite-type tricarboxylate transporter receptor subunit TctC